MTRHDELPAAGDEHPASVSDEELFRRYLGGDESAFEDLVGLHEDKLFHFIYGIVQDHHESKHLMIDAFAQLAVGGSHFAGKSSVKTYLFAIGKNLAARHMKKRGREQHIPFDEVVEMLVADRHMMPQEHLEQEESMLLVHMAMRSLKDDHRAVLALLYFEDMSYKEAGEAMGKSEKQIKHLAYRAKAALRKRLEDSGFASFVNA